MMSTPTQLSLFADDADRPAGLEYWPDVISTEDERHLIGMIRTLPLQPFQFGAYEGKRRVASFGFHYDYTARRLEDAEPVPAWLRQQAEKIERFRELAAGAIGHVLCTEYDIGVGIGWHRDKPQFEQVFGLSLGSACRFRFRRKSRDRWQRFTLDAEPRSLYLLTGDARHVWEHGIPAVDEPRYSITFRTMASRPSRPSP
ncbi:alpha-ketoglutarate-dependent dioxygenase AlkB [Bradyrhizobium sp. LHD-71]|uniref:alpha-ketoglutarate-dependent dioxygenase AlkB n=1 Tax=Bradyrhizobium sp. LHD-71 TaxID=3072141 RepID=UPI0028100CD4|nr:alpha-ketoglutarate-dependent dioxygenase AlkB [Bradyrhizobium sp. LHD-71]MDQ8729390.1 alpha-ketoglutarate-dependent dioxygenase AlkB [Bradyrhizobium sp. LHD-71]